MNQDQKLREALEANGCERLKDFYNVGPVQRAAVESFVAAITATKQAAPEYMHPVAILTKEVKPEHWEPQQAAPSQQTHAPCKGMNCGATDGVSHSLECEAEHSAAIAGGTFVKAAPSQGAGELAELSEEEKALGAFLSAMKDHGLDGSKMRQAMQKILGSQHQDRIPDEVLIAIRSAGLTLIKNQRGYELRNLGKIEAQSATLRQAPEQREQPADTVPVKRVRIHALSVALGSPEKLSALAGDTVEDSLVEMAATKLVSQQERQWVGLTENDREAIRLSVGQEYCPYTAEAIEVKLREKNAGLLAADAQRPALKPLTDEQKRAMWHGAHSVHSSWSAYEWYAQGVEDSEAAHGIKEQA